MVRNSEKNILPHQKQLLNDSRIDNQELDSLRQSYLLQPRSGKSCEDTNSKLYDFF